jgi:catechol-2,3-dioxygenase
MDTPEEYRNHFESGHVGLNITNLGRSVAFYQDVFGWSVVARSDAKDRTFALLGKDGKLTLTLWEQSKGATKRDTPGLHHLAFELKSMAEVRAAEQRLKEKRVHFHYDGAVPHAEGATSGGIYFEDPDGIRLEIYAADGAQGLIAPHADGPSCGFF